MFSERKAKLGRDRLFGVALGPVCFTRYADTKMATITPTTTIMIPPKEVSNRGFIADLLVVPEIERSVQSEELHCDSNGEDTGGEDSVPTPVAGIFQAPETHKGQREPEKDGDRRHELLAIRRWARNA